MKKHSFFYKNSLSIVFVSLMLITWVAQAFTGWHEHNDERIEKQLSEIPFSDYLSSGHFIQSSFENWESEFLQMALYVVLTIFLRQKGSSESKAMEGEEEVDKEPKPHSKAPWPVKKGGLWLKLYSSSLTIAFALLFIISFALHAYGTKLDMNEERMAEGKAFLSYLEVFGEGRFWFESFQNWQSEFLSVASIVFLSIFLRQKGSPESKPVDAPYEETGK